MDLKSKVHEFRQRLIQEEVARAGRTAGAPALLAVAKELSKLRMAYQEMYDVRNVVGSMPPSPNTLRAKAGGLLVRLVQRMLFWYTPEIQRFNTATAGALEGVCATFETQLAAAQQLFDQMSALRTEMRLYSHAGAAEPSEAPRGRLAGSAGDGFESFAMTLQDEILAPAERLSDLEKYLALLTELVPPMPAGPWLDLACGRGDWLDVVRSAGFQAAGIDANLMAVSHCRERGLSVCRAGPLDYLAGVPEAGFAVISAFHVLEKYPIEYSFQVVKLSARALKPGGVLILQCADPSNLLVSSHDFWCDPLNRRPLPCTTSVRLLEYFGLRVIAQRRLCPVPDDRQLPFEELDFVRQLNSLLYGSRVYGVLGRREPAG